MIPLTANDSLFAITYVSSATQPMSEADLDRLLRDAQERNHEEKVTGLLLHADGSFAQYLEGPKRALEGVYQRILASKLHTGITELMREPIDRREFPGWAMASSRAEGQQLLALSAADWRGQDGQDPATRPGLTLLRAIWSPRGSRAA